MTSCLLFLLFIDYIALSLHSSYLNPTNFSHNKQATYDIDTMLLVGKAHVDV